jgi:D-alanine-D-alanine ligase
VRVAVLAGGRSSEHEISLASATSVEASLAGAGHDVVHVELGRDGRWQEGGRSVPVEPGGGLLGADVVFPLLHGPFGEDGTVQGLLEIADVPYVGAGVLASAVGMDKLAFKGLMSAAGVPQVAHRAIYSEDPPDEWPERVASLGLPVFVKPARLGSSVGISKVTAVDELPGALGTALRHDPRVIVEAMADGMEVECSVIGNDEPIASEPGEIVAKGEWYDYASKYEPGGMELVVPARVGAAVRERVRDLALVAFREVSCAGMARIDFFVEDGGRVLVNELNTIPGFTATSVFARLFEASGIGYPELLERLLALALERHERDRSFRF